MRRLLKNLLSDKSAEQPEEPTSASFDDLLIRELDQPTVIELESESDIKPSRGYGLSQSEIVDSTVQENDRLRAELLPVKGPIDSRPEQARFDTGFGAPGPLFEQPVEEPAKVPDPAADRSVPGFQQTDFWGRYDEAAAAAELFSVPPAATTVVIGPLEVAVGVAQRCRARHWVSDCDVFVLTERSEVEAEPTWTILERPSDVVAVLEEGENDFPLIVLDIQRELPAWVRPLVARLRGSGVGLIHYVLDDEPSDEDLATWHGELGRPSVLDLAAYISPDRVLELLDKGEPIASVAGMPISTDLLLALRLGAGK